MANTVLRSERSDARRGVEGDLKAICLSGGEGSKGLPGKAGLGRLP